MSKIKKQNIVFATGILGVIIILTFVAIAGAFFIAREGAEVVDVVKNAEDRDLPELVEPQDQSPEVVKNLEPLSDEDQVEQNPKQSENAFLKEVDIEQINSSFKFSAEIPSNYEVEYVEASDAINIYNASVAAPSNIDASQIFITKFEADNFLTLQTVDILSEENMRVGERPARKYEIEKREDVDRFVNQPLWRSRKYKLVDIRFSEQSPSTFYVFAYNPQFGEGNFDEFISSLEFSESFTGFVDPLPRMQERDIIKPYGLFVTPSNSPVSPERFSGFHNAIDFEEIEGEGVDTPVFAICDGSLTRKTTASGYGGYMVQQCQYQGSTINVLYGHLAPRSFTSASRASKGDQIGVLGEAGTPDTDGERKHLHLAIQQTGSLDIRGYVQNESELSKWIDPELLLPFAR